SVQALIEVTLSQTFSFALRDFGQDVEASEMITLIQNIPGVVSVQLKALYVVGSSASLQSHLRAAAARFDPATQTIRPAQLLLINAPVVEFFKLLSMTQFLRNVNLSRGRTANVRNRKAMNEAVTPFNYLAHTIDTRSLPIDPMEQLRSGDPLESASLQGKYNLGNIG